MISQSAWPGDEYTYNYGAGNAGGGNSGLVALPRLAIANYNAKWTDVYAGDTMLFGNLTLQAGLRYDQQKGTTGGGAAAANSVVPDLLPAITVPQAPTLTCIAFCRPSLFSESMVVQ